jgi:hypothetical protein
VAYSGLSRYTVLKRPTILYLKRFGIKISKNIQEEETSPGSKHLLRTQEVIIVGYPSSPNVYPVLILEDEYGIMTKDLTFPKQTSPQVMTLSE